MITFDDDGSSYRKCSIVRLTHIERTREIERQSVCACMYVCVCICVFKYVWEKERFIQHNERSNNHVFEFEQFCHFSFTVWFVLIACLQWGMSVWMFLCVCVFRVIFISVLEARMILFDLTFTELLLLLFDSSFWLFELRLDEILWWFSFIFLLFLISRFGVTFDYYIIFYTFHSWFIIGSYVRFRFLIFILTVLFMHQIHLILSCFGNWFVQFTFH